MAEWGGDFDSVSFLGPPPASLDIRSSCGLMWSGDGICEIIMKRGDVAVIRRSLGRMAELLHPPASFSFRRLPWASVVIRGLRGRNVETRKLLGKDGKIAIIERT